MKIGGGIPTPIMSPELYENLHRAVVQVLVSRNIHNCRDCVPRYPTPVSSLIASSSSVIHPPRFLQSPSVHVSPQNLVVNCVGPPDSPQKVRERFLGGFRAIFGGCMHCHQPSPAIHACHLHSPSVPSPNPLPPNRHSSRPVIHPRYGHSMAQMGVV